MKKLATRAPVALRSRFGPASPCWRAGLQRRVTWPLL